MLPPGTLLDNKYEIVCNIGAGAFGCVYKAVQSQFDRQVAIKTLATTLLHEPDGAARFEREALAINSLKHRNIVAVYGFGSWQQAPYMVMELVEGPSLQDVLSTQGKLEPKRAATLIKQVFEALSCSHASGVIHRDLKPSNIMLVPGGEGPELVKIIDFGLARMMPGYGVPGQKLTETGYALGTCHYMPPEQALGQPVEQQADIYSAGCILYQMLTGNMPFDGDNNVAVMFQHLNCYAPPVHEIIPDHPMIPALSAFVSNCMAKQAADRYANCEDALADLNRILEGKFHSVKAFALVPQKASAPLLTRKKLVVTASSVALLVGMGLSVLTLKQAEMQNHLVERQSNDRTITELIGQAQQATDHRDYEESIPLLTEVLARNRRERILNEVREYDMTLDLVAAYRYAGLKASGRNMWGDEQLQASHDAANAAGVQTYLDRALALRRYDTSHRRDSSLMGLLRFHGRQKDAIALAHECFERSAFDTSRRDPGAMDSLQEHVIAAAETLAQTNQYDDALARIKGELNKNTGPMHPLFEDALIVSLLCAYRSKAHQESIVTVADGKREFSPSAWQQFQRDFQKRGFDKYLDRAYELSSRDLISVEHHQALIDVLIDFGRKEEAIKLSKRVIADLNATRKQGDETRFAEMALTRAHFILFNIYQHAGQQTEAASEAKALVEVATEPGHLDPAYTELGEQALRQHRYAAAQGYFSRAIALHKQEKPGYALIMGLGRAQFNQGHYADAQETMKLALDPRRARLPIGGFLLLLACKSKLEGPNAAKNMADKVEIAKCSATPFLRQDVEDSLRVLRETKSEAICDKYLPVLRGPLRDSRSI